MGYIGLLLNIAFHILDVVLDVLKIHTFLLILDPHGWIPVMDAVTCDHTVQ